MSDTFGIDGGGTWWWYVVVRIQGATPLASIFRPFRALMCAFLSPERAQYISEAVTPLAITARGTARGYVWWFVFKGLHPLLVYSALSGLSMCAFLSPERAQYISEAVTPLATIGFIFRPFRALMCAFFKPERARYISEAVTPLATMGFFYTLCLEKACALYVISTSNNTSTR